MHKSPQPIPKMQNLPTDVTNIILEYSNFHKFRFGKFMKQIHKNDARCTMLQQKMQSKIIKALNGNDRRFFVMLNINNKRWFCLMKEIFSEYIEIYLTEKDFPLYLNDKQANDVKKNGYGVLNRGYGVLSNGYENGCVVI